MKRYLVKSNSLHQTFINVKEEKLFISHNKTSNSFFAAIKFMVFTKFSHFAKIFFIIFTKIFYFTMYLHFAKFFFVFASFIFVKKCKIWRISYKLGQKILAFSCIFLRNVLFAGNPTQYLKPFLQ